MHRCVRNPPQADLITAAKHVINLARHRKLDERGRIAATAIAILAWQGRLQFRRRVDFVWGRL